MKKFMKENYLNSNIKLNRFNGFLSVIELPECLSLTLSLPLKLCQKLYQLPT